MIFGAFGEFCLWFYQLLHGISELSFKPIYTSNSQRQQASQNLFDHNFHMKLQPKKPKQTPDPKPPNTQLNYLPHRCQMQQLNNQKTNSYHLLAYNSSYRNSPSHLKSASSTIPLKSQGNCRLEIQVEGEYGNNRMENVKTGSLPNSPKVFVWGKGLERQKQWTVTGFRPHGNFRKKGKKGIEGSVNSCKKGQESFYIDLLIEKWRMNKEKRKRYQEPIEQTPENQIITENLPSEKLDKKKALPISLQLAKNLAEAISSPQQTNREDYPEQENSEFMDKGKEIEKDPTEKDLSQDEPSVIDSLMEENFTNSRSLELGDYFEKSKSNQEETEHRDDGQQTDNKCVHRQEIYVEEGLDATFEPSLKQFESIVVEENPENSDQVKNTQVQTVSAVQNREMIGANWTQSPTEKLPGKLKKEAVPFLYQKKGFPTQKKMDGFLKRLSKNKP